MRRTLGMGGLAVVSFGAPGYAQNLGEHRLLPTEASARAVVELPQGVVAQQSRMSSPRHDAPPPEVRSELGKSAQRVNWYGWQTMLTDGVAGLFALGAWAWKNDGAGGGFIAASVTTYALGGPIVHAANGNWGRAAGSLALRAGLPLGAALLTVSQASEGLDPDPLLVSLGLGIAGAVILDTALLARETVSEAPVVAPSVQVGNKRAWIGVNGKF